MVPRYTIIVTSVLSWWQQLFSEETEDVTTGVITALWIYMKTTRSSSSTYNKLGQQPTTKLAGKSKTLTLLQPHQCQVKLNCEPLGFTRVWIWAARERIFTQTHNALTVINSSPAPTRLAHVWLLSLHTHTHTHKMQQSVLACWSWPSTAVTSHMWRVVDISRNTSGKLELVLVGPDYWLPDWNIRGGWPNFLMHVCLYLYVHTGHDSQLDPLKALSGRKGNMTIYTYMNPSQLELR